MMFNAALTIFALYKYSWLFVLLLYGPHVLYSKLHMSFTKWSILYKGPEHFKVSLYCCLIWLVWDIFEILYMKKNFVTSRMVLLMVY